MNNIILQKIMDFRNYQLIYASNKDPIILFY